MSKHNIVIVVALALGLGACVSHAPGESGQAPAGVIRGTVTYDGPAQGTLEVAAFNTFPPRGNPVAVEFFEDPVFPQEYEIMGLPPGRYFILAVVDADPNDGAQYRPVLDAGGAVGGYLTPTSLTVSELEGSSAGNVELLGPMPNSPWGQQRYR